MANFAELVSNTVVLRVIVVENSDTSSADGTEKEYIGAAYCERLFGGRWVQTSYNGSIRGRYAGAGMIYNEEHNVFTGVKPYPSWVFDSTTKDWAAPTAKPNDGKQYDWSESTLSWVEKVAE